jgi:hypothetical protein
MKNANPDQPAVTALVESTYYISDGLVSVNKIGEKYCPNNTEWVSVVNSIWNDFNKKLH